MQKPIVTYEISLELNRLGYYQSVDYYNLYNRHVFGLVVTTHSEGVIAPTYERAIEWLKETRNMNASEDTLLEILKALR